MTPYEILSMSSAEGVILSLTDQGKLKIVGKSVVVEKWSSLIRENKVAIVETISNQKKTIGQTPKPCTDCIRLELIDIMGQPVAGCLYEATGPYPDAWRQIPSNLSRCLWD